VVAALVDRDQSPITWRSSVLAGGDRRYARARVLPSCSGNVFADSGITDVFGARTFAGFALNVAGGAVLLLGLHIADEIVCRAAVSAHGGPS